MELMNGVGDSVRQRVGQTSGDASLFGTKAVHFQSLLLISQQH